MGDPRHDERRRGDLADRPDRPERDEGPGPVERGYGYGYGGAGRADAQPPGSAGSTFDPAPGYGYGGTDDRSRYAAPAGPHGGERNFVERVGERNFVERAGDEIASWMGDDGGARRRAAGAHRGKGPRGYKRSDARILEDVSDRLSDAPHLDASDIEVAVADGEVTLSGKVDAKAAKRDAEDCADAVSGVRHVQNNLRVRVEAGASDKPETAP